MPTLGYNYCLQIIETGFAEQFKASRRMGPPLVCLKISAWISGGQISTKHQKTSTKPFFATCRLLQYPEFWRCVETGTLFLGPHWKRSLKGLDNLLTVTTPNTQLLPRPRKMSLSSYIYVFHMRHPVWLLAVAPYGQTLRTYGQWTETGNLRTSSTPLTPPPPMMKK